MRTKEQKRRLIKRNRLFAVIASFTLLTALVYVPFARPWKAILEYSLYTGIPLYLIVFPFLIYGIIKEGFKKELLIPIFGAPFSFTFGGLMLYSIGVLIIDVLKAIEQLQLPIDQKALLTSILILVIGIAFFLFRKFQRSTYGIIEIIIGLYVGYNLVIQFDSNITNQAFYIPFLASSVYLVVRGIDNLEQGFIKEPIDPVAKWLKSFIQRF